MLTSIQTQRPGETIPLPFHPFVLAGSACPTCGLATVCATCNRCHYCEDIDLPCLGSQQKQHASIIPFYPFSRDEYPLAVLADGLLESDPEEHQGNGQEEPLSNLVEPDLPTNFDQLTDEELADWICRLIAQASRLYRFGASVEENEFPFFPLDQAEKASLFVHVRHTPGMYGGLPVIPVVRRASLFSKNWEGSAR